MLKPKSGEIDRNSGEYYLENDLSVRVLVHASKDGAQDNVGNVQKSWEVILADGTKMFYYGQVLRTYALTLSACNALACLAELASE